MEKSIRKEIMTYAIPGILGLVANSLYIVVDGIFVSKMLGAKSLAAVTTVVPVVEILIALSLMIAIGGGIHISIQKGRNNLEESRYYFNQGFYFVIGISILILIGSMVFRNSIVTLLGATPDIYEEALNYFTWFMMFVPFFTLNYALGTWIRNDGKPNLAMFAQVIGALANIVLDYIFMGPMKMGIAGAAIATGLGPVIGIALLLPHFIFKKGDLYIEKVRPKVSYIKNILVGGLPSFSIEFSLGLMSFLMNLFIAKSMGAEGLAAFGVIGYINLILLSVFLGIGQGTQPLVSRFYGEHDIESIKEVYNFSVILSIVFGIVSYGLLLVTRSTVIGIFVEAHDTEVIALCFTAITYFFFSYSVTGVNVATASIFEAKHSVLFSVLISLFRSFIILVPMLFIMNGFPNASALWLAVPLTEIITLPFSLILWNKDFKKTKSDFKLHESTSNL